MKNETAQHSKSKALLQWQQYYARGNLALNFLQKRSKKMSDKKVVKENSNAPKGHGPGKEVKPGANVVPKSWWTGKGKKSSPNN